MVAVRFYRVEGEARRQEGDGRRRWWILMSLISELKRGERSRWGNTVSVEGRRREWFDSSRW
jgi:hypothetical protein